MTDPHLLPADRPGIIEAVGPDAIRFINGQITQDARGLNDRCLPACITDAKGRLQHFVEIMQGPAADSLWILTRPGETDEVLARLDRYLISDDATLMPVDPDRWVRVRARAETGAVAADMARRSGLWFDDGCDLWWQGPPGPMPEPPSSVEIEDYRIRRGLPAWGRELTAGVLPPEAGLDRNSISYHKGCYIGQEVLSRIKSAGKVNRRLTRFSISPPLPLGLPDDGLAFEAAGKPAGSLTSLSSCGTLALGYLSRTAFDAPEFRVPGHGDVRITLPSNA